MSITYLSGDRKFILDYQELREHHYRLQSMSDDMFLKNIPDAIHLACIISFLKGIPTYVCLSDTGIIHELVHLLNDDGTTTPLHEIRELFNTTLKLV